MQALKRAKHNPMLNTTLDKYIAKTIVVVSVLN